MCQTSPIRLTCGMFPADRNSPPLPPVLLVKSLRWILRSSPSAAATHQTHPPTVLPQDCLNPPLRCLRYLLFKTSEHHCPLQRRIRPIPNSSTPGSPQPSPFVAFATFCSKPSEHHCPLPRRIRPIPNSSTPGSPQPSPFVAFATFCSKPSEHSLPAAATDQTDPQQFYPRIASTLPFVSFATFCSKLPNITARCSDGSDRSPTVLPQDRLNPPLRCLRYVLFKTFRTSLSAAATDQTDPQQFYPGSPQPSPFVAFATFCSKPSETSLSAAATHQTHPQQFCPRIASTLPFVAFATFCSKLPKLPCRCLRRIRLTPTVLPSIASTLPLRCLRYLLFKTFCEPRQAIRFAKLRPSRAELL